MAIASADLANRRAFGSKDVRRMRFRWSDGNAFPALTDGMAIGKDVKQSPEASTAMLVRLAWPSGRVGGQE